jgi:hypothetical protein
VADKAEVIRGPWPALRPGGDPRAPGAAAAPAAREPADAIAAGKMMLGFVVRECTIALGHAPSPAELAEWANHQQDDRGEFCLFGRAITAAEASVILKHPGRPVAVRAERMRPRDGADPELRSRS